MMKTLVGCLSLTVAACGFTSAHAEEIIRGKSPTDVWLLEEFPEASRCAVARKIRHKETGQVELVIVTYSAEKKELTVTLTSQNTTSLGAEGVVNLNVLLTERGGTVLNQSWGYRDVHYRRDGEWHFFDVYFSGGDEVERILHDLSVSDAITVETDRGKSVGVGLLGGSSKSIARLKERAFRVAGLNPRDPFVQ